MHRVLEKFKSGAVNVVSGVKFLAVYVRARAASEVNRINVNDLFKYVPEVYVSNVLFISFEIEA